MFRPRIAGALSLAGALLLAGCGGGQGDDTAASSSAEKEINVLAAAYDSTREAESARIESKFSFQAGNGAATVNTTGKATGVIDFANDNARITMEVPVAGSIEMRLVDGVRYVKLPTPPAGATGAPRGWIKHDESGSSAAGDGGPFGASGLNDILGVLRGSSESVQEVGTEEIRGAEATHYTAKVNLAEVAEDEGASAEDVKRLREQLRGDTVPVDLWVDEEGRAVRVAVKMTVPVRDGNSSSPARSAAGAEGPQVSISTDYYDFGVDVNVQAPPADQVREAPWPHHPPATASNPPAA